MGRKESEREDIQALASFYNREEGSQELLQHFFETVRRYVVDGSSRREHKRRNVSSILEVGGGEAGGLVGLVWRASYPNAKEVRVIDIKDSAITFSRESINEARQVLRRDPAIHIEQVDITKPERKMSRAFDIVSVRNPRIAGPSDANAQAFISAAYDAVKPGGIIFMTAEMEKELNYAQGFIDNKAIWEVKPTPNKYAMQQAAFRDRFVMVGRKPEKNVL